MANDNKEHLKNLVTENITKTKDIILLLEATEVSQVHIIKKQSELIQKSKEFIFKEHEKINDIIKDTFPEKIKVSLLTYMAVQLAEESINCGECEKIKICDQLPKKFYEENKKDIKYIITFMDEHPETKSIKDIEVNHNGKH